MFYNNCRQQEKKLKHLMMDYKKKSERKTARLSKLLGDPLQQIHVVGTACTLQFDPIEHKCQEEGEKLMRWQGDETLLVDPYDAISHLDSLPIFSNIAPRKTAQEEQEEEECQFERYRSIVETARHGYSEEDVIRMVELEIDDTRQRFELHQARSKPHSTVIENEQQQSSIPSATDNDYQSHSRQQAPRAEGQYSQVGYIYENPEIRKEEQLHRLQSEIVSASVKENAEEEQHEEQQDQSFVTENELILNEKLDMNKEREMNRLGKEVGIKDYLKWYWIDRGDREDRKRNEELQEEDGKNRETMTRKERKQERRRQRAKEREIRMKEMGIDNDDHTLRKRRHSPSYSNYEGPDMNLSDQKRAKVGGEDYSSPSVDEKHRFNSDTKVVQPQPEKIEKKVEAVDSASPASIIAKIEKELTTNKKLTPQEKLKLRTKLQFNKKIEKDHKQEQQKKEQEKVQRKKRIQDLNQQVQKLSKK